MTYATLESYNQTPRKVRLVTDLVKGKSVTAALATLQFLPKRAAEPIAKLIKSAVASAKEMGENPETLTVQTITVEGAGMLKKYMPRAFGRASLIRRRKSRVKVTLVAEGGKSAPARAGREKVAKPAVLAQNTTENL